MWPRPPGSKQHMTCHKNSAVYKQLAFLLAPKSVSNGQFFPECTRARCGRGAPVRAGVRRRGPSEGGVRPRKSEPDRGAHRLQPGPRAPDGNLATAHRRGLKIRQQQNNIYFNKSLYIYYIYSFLIILCSKCLFFKL